MINIHVLDKESITDPMFDLIPGKHGHILGKEGEIKEVSGMRMVVPFLDISSETIHQISEFIDDMDGTVTHPEVTLIIKEAGHISAKIGIFAI